MDPELAAEIDAELARAAPGAAPSVPGAVYARRLAANRTSRRAAGSYYTPRHLVDFAIERALGPLLVGRSAAEALALRVLEPACGAGAFLLAALERIWAHGCGLLPQAEHAEYRRAVARRCLFGVDRDATAVNVCRLSLELALDGKESDASLAAHIVERDALFEPLPFDADFDAVVGNPPWGQKGFRWSPAQRRRLRGDYRVGRGVVDPYAVFVERSIELLADGGRWAMVLPDVLLLKNEQLVRDLILERCAIEWIADAGRAFDGVALDVVVVAAQRRSIERDDPHRVAVWHSVPTTWRTDPPETIQIEQRRFWELPGHKLNVRITDPELALWRRLRTNSGCLGDCFEIHEGVHTGNARRKLFLDRRASPKCEKLAVGRKELTRWALTWKGAWLNRSPTAIDREAGDYANLGRPEWHERPKIVVRRTGDYIVAALDREGLWVSNNMFVLVPTSATVSGELAAFVGLLNSQLMTWYYRVVQPRVGRLFAELKINHLRDFPVPAPIVWGRVAEPIGRLASEIELAVRAGEPIESPQRTVDDAVATAFALDAAERDLIATR